MTREQDATTERFDAFLDATHFPKQDATHFPKQHDILREAANLVASDRADAYGDCIILHRRIAKLFNAYMDGREEASAYDAAVFLLLVKIARMRHKPSSDSHIDIAGYASICQTIFEEEENGGG